VRIALIFSLLFVVVASGCGYKMQGRADLPFKEIAIGEIENKTGEPKLQDKMHRLLAETFMEYGVDVRNSARYKIDGSFSKFEVYPVAEKDLKAVEYKLNITGSFRMIDTETKIEDKKSRRTKVTAFAKKTEYKTEALGAVTNPYPTYFRSTGLLVNVLAEKELATERALKDMSQEIVLRIIYKMPKVEEKAKKGELKVEPETVPAGNR